ncbi:hypothetical protein Tco_0987922 [Tanacetum coccineum]
MKSRDFNNDLMKLSTRLGTEFNDLTQLVHANIHGFSKLIKLDTLYALNANDQDSLNLPRGCSAAAISIKDIPVYRAELANQNSNSRFISPLKISKTTQENIQNTVTTKIKEILTTKAKFFDLRLINHRFTSSTLPSSSSENTGVSKDDFQNYVKANDAVMRNMQNQNQNLQNQMTNLTDMLSKFVNSNTASTSDPTIPTTFSPPKVVERETEVTKDTVLPTNNEVTKDVQPSVVQVQSQVPNSEPVVIPVSALMPNLKPSIPYPSRRNDEKRHEKAKNSKFEHFFNIFQRYEFRN